MAPWATVPQIDPTCINAAGSHMPTKVPQSGGYARALALGARLLEDRSDDSEEPLRVYADPAGHPFCIIAAI